MSNGQVETPAVLSSSTEEPVVVEPTADVQGETLEDSLKSGKEPPRPGFQTETTDILQPRLEHDGIGIGQDDPTALQTRMTSMPQRTPTLLSTTVHGLNLQQPSEPESKWTQDLQGPPR